MRQESLFMTVIEAATELGVSRAYCYRLVQLGLIPAVRRGRRVLVPREAWGRWLKGQTEAALGAVSEAQAGR